jgi:hypothetical protein
VSVWFLVDTGADRTVFSADALTALGIQPQEAGKLGGVGGEVESVVVKTAIRMVRENGTTVLFNGHYAGFTQPEALDMSVLGRDISNLFGLIVDRPQDVACLVGHGHRYVIVSP